MRELKIIILVFFTFGIVTLQGQSPTIYYDELKGLLDGAKRTFTLYQDFHNAFFKVPSNWDSLDCGQNRLPLIRHWENETKPEAYRKFIDKIFFTQNGPVFKEAISHGWNSANVLATGFQNFVLGYFTDHNQIYLNGICANLRSAAPGTETKFFRKQIELDSIGSPVGIDKEADVFMPVFFRSQRELFSGQIKSYPRIMVLKVKKTGSSWNVTVHFIFNRTSDWQEYFGIYPIRLESAKPQGERSQIIGTTRAPMISEVRSELCGTIEVPTEQLTNELVRDYIRIIQDLSDPGIHSIQQGKVSRLVEESIAKLFIEQSGIIEYWNYGEKSPTQRTVKQYLEALRRITKSSVANGWYEFVSICVPKEEIKILDKELTSPSQGHYKFSVDFAQYYYTEGGTRTNYRDKTIKRMNIIVPIRHCQYGQPKITSILAIKEPELLMEIPSNLDCQ